MSGGGPEGPGADDEPGSLAGLRWQQVQQPGFFGYPGGWRDWLARSIAARRLAVSLAVADSVAIAIVVTVIAASVIRGRPAGGVQYLLAPGILLVVAGQVWAVLVITARRPPRTGRRLLAGPNRGRSISEDLISSFGPVDRRVATIVGALCVIGFLSFITAIFFTWQGGPAGPGGGCLYRLEGHGIYTCVSKSAYDLAGAAQQRIAAGPLLFFFAIHLYAALASSKANWPLTVIGVDGSGS